MAGALFRLVMHFVFGHERDWPTPKRLWKELTKYRVRARIRQGKKPGTIVAYGVERGEDGWKTASGKHARSYRQ